MRLPVVIVACLMLAGTAACARSDMTGSPAVQPIKGRVVDSSGKPVPNAKVDCYTRKYGERYTPKAVTTCTDKQGRFVFKPTERPRRGTYSFSAYAPGFCRVTSGIPADNPSDVTITLWPAHTLVGKVVDENGAPVPGATVTVKYCYGFRDDGETFAQCSCTPDKPLAAVTGRDGRFNLKGVLRPQDFENIYAGVSIRKKARATINDRLDKERLEGEIRLTQPLECVLEGTLRLPGGTGVAPKGTRIAVHMFNERMADQREAFVEKDGRFRLGELPPGKVHVSLAPPREAWRVDGGPVVPKPNAWALPAVMDVELTPDKPKVLDLELTRGAMIKGAVVDAATGKGIGKAKITVQHAGKPEGVSPDYSYTDDRGEFTVRVAAGNVTIAVEQARDAWFQPDDWPSVTFKVADGDEKSDIVIKVDSSQSGSIYEEVTNKPVPPDFELKPGTYELIWDPDLDCSNAVRLRMELTGDQVTAKLKGAPRWGSDKPRCQAYRFDGTRDEGLLVVAEDESGGPGKGYDTAYIDRNRNWDLSDDEPIRFKPVRKYHQIHTEWVEIQSGGRPARVRLEIYSPDGQELYVTPQRKGGWRGTIETNKGRVDCAVVDSNANGVYGEVWKWHDDLQPDVWGDEVYVDCNGFGKVVLAGWSPHSVPINPISRVGNRYYFIKIDDAQSKLTIEPYAGPMGTLIVRGENIQGLKADVGDISVVGKNGAYQIKGASGRPAALPAGSYRLVWCKVILKSKDARDLKLGCQLNRSVEVRPEEETSATITGELSLAINPGQKELVWKPGGPQTLQWMMKIGDDATVFSIGESLPQYSPKVKFFSRSGKLLYTTTAGYT